MNLKGVLDLPYFTTGQLAAYSITQPSGIELSSNSDHCLFKRSETLCFSPAQCVYSSSLSPNPSLLSYLQLSQLSKSVRGTSERTAERNCQGDFEKGAVYSQLALGLNKDSFIISGQVEPTRCLHDCKACSEKCPLLRHPYQSPRRVILL